MRRGILLSFALAVACTGCVVGPDFHSPAVPQASGFVRGSDAQAMSADGTTMPDSQWWRAFHNAGIDAAIATAFRNSPMLRAAQANLEQAQALARAQRRSLLPSASAGYNVSRQRNSSTISPPLSDNSNLYTLHTAQLTVGYVPDVFGGNRRQVESLAAQEESQRHQLDAARQMLAANVVINLIQLSSLDAQVAAGQDIVSANRESLDLTRRQEALGALGKLDVSTQETALQQARGALDALLKQRETFRDALAVLLGRTPSELKVPNIALDSLAVPDRIPVSVPAGLARRRPDIAAAEAQVHAATAQVGVAVANRFPQFAINATYGGSASKFGGMFATGNVFWSLVGGVTQPVFDFGVLKAKQKAAEAGMRVAMEQYRQTVLMAFQNVADAMYALKADDEAAQAALRAETATRQTFDFTRRGRELGSASALNVLSAQQAWQQARLSALQARGQHLQDAVALMVAVAGPVEGDATTNPGR